MRTSLSNNNFSAGIVNCSVNGRYDLPIYRNGLSICENYSISYEGGLKNRTGLIKLFETTESVFIPFVFSKEQAYLIQFTITNKIRFLTYSSDGTFGYILDEKNKIYELESPYTLNEVRKVQYAQKNDVMYLTYKDYTPKKLTRISATTFKIGDVIFTDISPFTASTGYPSAVCFYENRLFYGGIKNKPTFIYASDIGYYDKFSLTGTDDDLDGFTFDLAETNQNIDWIFPIQNTLVCGCSDGLLYCNGGSANVAMTKKNFSSRQASESGSNGIAPIKNDNSVVYIDRTERKCRSFSYDLVSEKFNTPNLNILNSDFTINGFKTIKTLQNKFNFIYVLKNDGSILLLNLLPDENINTWTVLKFYNNIKEIQNIPRGYDTFEDMICLVKENNQYYICKLADEIELKNEDNFFTGNKEYDKQVYQRYVSEQSKKFNYLDMSKRFSDERKSTITFNNNYITSTSADFNINDINKNIVYKSEDGKNFGIFKILEIISENKVKVEDLRGTHSTDTYNDWYLTFGTLTISDSYYFNKTISIVGDGGYLGEYKVSQNGFIDIRRQITVAIIGFKYISVAKSLNLGYEINGINTQITNKNIIEVNLRLNNSAGGEFTTNRYEPQSIQDFNPDGYYDNIPLLMNGDKKIKVFDSWQAEKYYYIIQNKPLPLHLTMITLTREDNSL